MSGPSNDPEVQLFVRDDDVGELTEALRFFAETFLSRRIPVSYQVIPARFSQEAADYLLGLWRRHPELIEFGQHGLTHAMEVRGRPTKREFGPERSEAEQRAIIAEGLALLHARLNGEPPIRLFTPPRHKYDGATVRAAADAGHRVFSASFYPSARHQAAYRVGRRLGMSSIRHHGISHHGRRRPEAPITEVSIAVDVDDGIVLRYPAAAVAAAIARAGSRTDAVGLMFHHEIYASAGLQAKLIALADRLSELGAKRFRLLGDVAQRLDDRARAAKAV